MKVLFHLAHPAHFHLFKNVIKDLKYLNENVFITFNDKDILEDLIQKSELKDISIKLKARKTLLTKKDLVLQFYEKIYSLYKILKKEKPDLVMGTSIIISIAGRILGIPNTIVNEDDFDIIKYTANIGYHFADKIICPEVCRTGKWEYKCIKHNSYHELSYLHPNHFTPDIRVVEKYISIDRPFSIMRFAKLSAHHDVGIKGINDNYAIKVIKKLENYGDVYITSERDIGPELNDYRLEINPLDIHHFLAFSKLYIGDSQTMAAEAAVLGTPFIRVNDFVNRISYLDELENKYNLGYGLLPNNAESIYELIDRILNSDYYELARKKQKMLDEKIDFSNYLTNYIKNFVRIKN
ncbi:MAG TPA: DUF354 domain-containing protein [Melioribacteraceae bacterium]|mgnify:CR=1 FL=1|nr:DUF354 domain-containing protein [Melioribacteraceae bacterium]